VRRIHRVHFPILVSPAVHCGAAAVAPILLDNFAGSGALTAHTPDIAPVGSSWAIISGVFGNLSGGYLPYLNTNWGKAIINVGVDNFELRYKSKYKTLTAGLEHGGVMFRSDAAGSDFSYLDYSYSGSSPILFCSLGGGVKLDPSQPGVNSCYITVTGDQFYEWRLLLNGGMWRVYNADGTMIMTGSGAAGTGKYYVGPFNMQNAYPSAWDFIEVKPITAHIINFSVMGDSISNNVNEWPYIVAARSNNGYCWTLDHAVSGSSIMSHMDLQTDLCEADNAEFTIVALGTNDGGADITTVYQQNLIELYGTLGKPIYAVGIFPKDPDTYRTLQNGRIQTAVSNAQSAGVNVTYWDTDGWIDPATDTSDGLHPNESGQLKIANEILALL